ncbi:hypothetical protein GCM10022223_01100 [Kineosporia mesophila]|uniref:Transglycosylase SLT domain-containing protein n=1 Tax=Kineosporia mesophila TaxID=566012 RepID=A0ABP6YSW0_9ACTN|nr:transglycosylase SLT domain-containing protein [Kineosporia mesophila]MCD5352240.1 transglycosylase SLT domain-containing protein [Kineosporia mesophila]
MRRDPGRTVERPYVVPSALRSLSVAVLLVAVSGTAIATAPQSHGTGGSADVDLRAAEQDLTGRIALTGSTTTLAASPLSVIGAQNASAVVDAGALAEKKKKAAAKKAAAKKAAAKKAAAKKAAAKKAAAKRRAQARAQASRTSPRSAKAVARLMVSQRGWKSGQYTCLVKLWEKESNWRHNAQNRSSGAYGIPQSLPGSKMSSAGRDWRSNPSTQIKWGLRYIQERYGSPCGAWAHSRSVGWY